MIFEKAKKRKDNKVLVLFSGGLDSRLVVKILAEQKDPKLDLELIYFKLPFGCGCCSNECNFNFSQTNSIKLTIFDCTKGKLFQDYLRIIRSPKFGRGSSMNPCIDCKIFMFKKAKEYADKNNIKIIATGEVLGERPMSQTKNAMNSIDNELGFEILRPLSARLLQETLAEKEKIVDRTRFLAIQGRKRNIQLELARKFNIKFPMPSGGCLLCEKAYKNRLKDLFDNYKKISPEQLQTLMNFRHFKSIETKGKIILGRNELENNTLLELNKKLKYNIIFAPENAPGPTALFENKLDKVLVEKLIRAYSSKDLEKRKKFEEMKL
jgi:hypothetical protein